MKIEFFNLGRIRIKEIPAVVNGVVGIVEKYNPLSLGVKPLFDILVEQQLQLGSLTNSGVGHPLSPTIKQDRKRMRNLCGAIVTQSRAIEKANLPTTSEAAYLILPLVKKYLLNIDKINNKEAENNMKDFLSITSKTELMSQATTAIGIDGYINELKVVENRLNTNFDVRLTENAERRIIVDMKLKSGILKALANLIKAIELAQVHNTTVDFTPMVAELNELFVPYRALIQSRSTRNKNAQIKKETAASSTTTTATAT
jgi:hypothetical protein